MNKESFDELLESIREGGAILRGERKPARVFNYPPRDFGSGQTAPMPWDDERVERKPERDEVFAICIASDDPELLQTRKLYRVRLLPDDLLSVVDEAGETAVYPAEQFILIELPREIEEALSRVA